VIFDRVERWMILESRDIAMSCNRQRNLCRNLHYHSRQMKNMANRAVGGGPGFMVMEEV
jgi:hypothetical protein